MRSPASEQVPETRDDVVEILLDTIGVLKQSIAQQVPETPAEHRRYLEEVRTFGQLAEQYRLLTRDTDVDEMQDQLELPAGPRDPGGSMSGGVRTSSSRPCRGGEVWR
jgi:hypothetical protein